MIYLLGVLIVTWVGFGVCMVFVGSGGDNKDQVKDYMRKREKNMQQILDEDFGEEGILQTESGETYHIQMGKYGSFIVVDVLSSFDKIQKSGNEIKLKTKSDKTNKQQKKRGQEFSQNKPAQNQG